MIAEGGHAALWLAAAFALLAASGNRLKLDLTTPATIVSALLGLVALLALVWCYLAADFSLIAIDDRVHRLQPPLVRLAMLLGSPHGIALLFAMLLASFAIIVPRLAPLATLAFAATLALQPFARQPIVPPEGRSLMIPADLAAALFQPPLLVLAAALLLAALASGRPTRPPRWLSLVALSALLLGGVGVAAAQFGTETAATLRPGQTLRLNGIEARLLALHPVAGPGYTAVEAEVAVGSDILRPQARTLVHSEAEAEIPASIQAGLSRIEVTLGPQRGEGRELRLRWSPL